MWVGLVKSVDGLNGTKTDGLRAGGASGLDLPPWLLPGPPSHQPVLQILALTASGIVLANSLRENLSFMQAYPIASVSLEIPDSHTQE